MPTLQVNRSGQCWPPWWVERLYSIPPFKDLLGDCQGQCQELPLFPRLPPSHPWGHQARTESPPVCKLMPWNKLSSLGYSTALSQAPLPCLIISISLFLSRPTYTHTHNRCAHTHTHTHTSLFWTISNIASRHGVSLSSMYFNTASGNINSGPTYSIHFPSHTSHTIAKQDPDLMSYYL